MPRYDDEDDDDGRSERPTRRRRRDSEDDDRDLPPSPKKSKTGLILGIVAGVLFLLCAGGGTCAFFFFRGFSGAADNMVATNDCRQIGVGAHNYFSANQAFPTNSYNPTGRPLLSWRVHLLPYIEQDVLYRKFNLNEAWDGPTNRPLLDQMPLIYARVDDRKGGVAATNRTFYRGFSNPGAMFAGKEAPKGLGKKLPLDNPFIEKAPRGATFADIKDGQSNTILFLEAGEPIFWTRPDDLDASPGKPFPSLGGARPKEDTVIVVFVDGSVKLIKKSTPESNWRGAVTIAGNDVGILD